MLDFGLGDFVAIFGPVFDMLSGFMKSVGFAGVALLSILFSFFLMMLLFRFLSKNRFSGSGAIRRVSGLKDSTSNDKKGK